MAILSNLQSVGCYSIDQMKYMIIVVPSIFIGLVEAALRPYFPDGRLWFFSMFLDICNDIKFIFIFVLGYGITAADEFGMKEIIRKSRWFNFVIGRNIKIWRSSQNLKNATGNNCPGDLQPPACA